jgi:putative ABC transport system permease protein
MKLLISVIGLALATLRENKIRSFLTVLGVIIGTGTIIAVGSILAGLDGAVTGVIRSFGTNTAIVFKMKMGPGFGGRTAEERNRKPLTFENAVAIAERCPSVEHVSPYLFPSGGLGGPGGPVSTMRARYKGNEYLSPQLGGTDDGYLNSGQAEMKFGRFFTDMENSHHLPVAVIGEDVYSSIFGTSDAIGKKMEVGGAELEVIGVMVKPASSLPGQDDNRILLPYFTMHKMFPSARENMLVVAAKNGMLPAAIDEITAVLRQERHVALSAPDNFAISTADQMVEDFRSVTAMVTIVMVVLSSIGLLVGGIGVMNIMLVSVTERTREIGVRKAIGARRSDIIFQFLTEAVVLTFLGGLCGMAVGYTISLAAHFAFPNLPTMVPMWAAGLGIVVSVGIGLFFGIWPASKAARLDPVDALRYE